MLVKARGGAASVRHTHAGGALSLILLVLTLALTVLGSVANADEVPGHPVVVPISLWLVKS